MKRNVSAMTLLRGSIHSRHMKRDTGEFPLAFSGLTPFSNKFYFLSYMDNVNRSASHSIL